MTSTTTSWWRSDAETWQADGWSLELRGDELADIRRGGSVILRAVRAVMRDHGWNTVPAVVTGVKSDHESLSLGLRHEGLGAELVSTLTIETSGGDLRIAWDAENLRDFSTCRTGLVVLHPASDAGRRVTVTHPDGRTEQTAFPVRISPHQPIMDIRALELHLASETDAATALRFDGDVFEMEDQRNWSDASFKTYSRPLGLPYPYPLSAGERVQQSITVEAVRTPSAEHPAPQEISLVEGGPFPAVGVEASTAPDPGRHCADGRFRVVELNLTTPTWPAALLRAAADGLPLDVRLVIGEEPKPLADAANALATHRLVAVTPFDSVLHVSDERTVASTRAALGTAGVRTQLRGGARSHFTELNRERERIPNDLDGIAFTTTPLFHSLDTEQLVEALPIQRLIAIQAVEMADRRPVHIGPVSLRARFNNVATSPEPAPTLPDLTEGYGAQFTGGEDARQNSTELAAWTIASAAALAVPGVESLSWFETWGPRGLRDATGAPHPAAQAVTELAMLEGRTLLWGSSPDGLLWAIGARADDDDVVLVANLDRMPREFAVAAAGRPTLRGSADAGSWLRLAATTGARAT
ncbi:hypothetical protein [Microbacterium murale]|uniref:Beta-galactosidase n=1 Tax=Microbacterium murale TaxID=1081040 RepID=A0ABU0PA29_9MICO|nr:hypothetical protein [Microbacterium murale]MDQ0644185.1 hypothetical protein [Microbacterium murale]